MLFYYTRSQLNTLLLIKKRQNERRILLKINNFFNLFYHRIKIVLLILFNKVFYTVSSFSKIYVLFILINTTHTILDIAQSNTVFWRAFSFLAISLNSNPRLLLKRQILQKFITAKNCAY